MDDLSQEKQWFITSKKFMEQQTDATNLYPGVGFSNIVFFDLNLKKTKTGLKRVIIRGNHGQPLRHARFPAPVC